MTAFNVATQPQVLIGDPLASPSIQHVRAYSPDVIAASLKLLGLLDEMIERDDEPPSALGIWFKRDQATSPKPLRGTNGPGEVFVNLGLGAGWQPCTLALFASFLAMKGGARDAGNLTAGTVPDARLPGRLSGTPMAIADWDAAVETGWFQSDGAAAHSPHPGAVVVGMVVSSAANWVTQLAWTDRTDDPSDTKTYRRERNNGVWSTWYRVLVSKDEMDALYGSGASSSDADFSIKDRDLAAPPGAPATGDRYLVAAGASGAWVGQSGKFARWNGASWVFDDFVEGMLAWVDDENLMLGFDGTGLVVFPGGTGPTAASQGEVNAGVLDTKFVTPLTLKGRTPPAEEARAIVNSIQADSGVGGAFQDLKTSLTPGGAVGASKALTAALEGVDRWTVDLGDPGSQGLSFSVVGGGFSNVTSTNTYQLWISLDGGLNFSAITGGITGGLSRHCAIIPLGNVTTWQAQLARGDAAAVDVFNIARGSGSIIIQLRRASGVVNLSALNSYFAVTRLS